MSLNVLDLPLSTCVCVCVCLHLKHFPNRSLDLFANDLVLFENSFFYPWFPHISSVLLFLNNILCCSAVFQFTFPFSFIVEGQIKRVCLQWVAGVIYSHLMCSALCRGGVPSTALDLNHFPSWESGSLLVSHLSCFVSCLPPFIAPFFLSVPALWSHIQCRETLSSPGIDCISLTGRGYSP